MILELRNLIADEPREKAGQPCDAVIIATLGILSLNYYGVIMSLPKVISDYISNPASTQDKNYLKQLRKLARKLRKFAPTHVDKDEFGLSADYYCYIYLDPRIPGAYEYLCPSGKLVRFKFRPFYVGKGSRRRMLAHLNVDKATNTYKKRIVADLLKLGQKPIIVPTKSRFDEALALAFEVDLIAGIGRADLREGPLSNLTNGGDGFSGYVFTEKDRKKMSRKQRQRFDNETQEEKDSRTSKAKATKAANPDVEKERVRKIKEHNNLETVKREKSNFTKKQWQQDGFRDHHLNSVRVTWSSKTSEERKQFSANVGAASKRAWAKLSKEERQHRVSLVIEGRKIKPFMWLLADGRFVYVNNMSVRQFCINHKLKYSKARSVLFNDADYEKMYGYMINNDT